MKDEIKETLEDVKIHLDYVEATKQASIRDNEMKVMYNYITNLQDRINELEQINEEHRKINGELHSRINKTIDYIKHEFQLIDMGTGFKTYIRGGKDMLEILEGDNKGE